MDKNTPINMGNHTVWIGDVVEEEGLSAEADDHTKTKLTKL